MQEEVATSVKKPWKKIIVLIVIILAGVSFLLGGYFLYETKIVSEKFKKSGGDFTLSCKLTGGNIETNSCGSACWDGYPNTKDERIKNETTPEEWRACTMQCVANTYCTCPSGKYFGSIEEGCIDKSEQKKVSKEDQDTFDRKRETEWKELEKKWENEYKQKEREKIQAEGFTPTNVDGINFEYSTRDIGRFYNDTCSMSGCICEGSRCTIKLDNSKLNKIYTNNLPKKSMDITAIREIIPSKVPIENPTEAIHELMDSPYSSGCQIKTSSLFEGKIREEYELYDIKNDQYNRGYEGTFWPCSSLIYDGLDGYGNGGMPLQYFMYSKKSKRLLYINLSSDGYAINPYTIDF